MQNKYGNTTVKLPETYALEKEAVLKAVNDGTIDEAEGRRQVLKIQHAANLFIVMTNGGYQLPTRRKRAAARKMRKVQEHLDRAEKMLAEAEKTPEDETIEDPNAPGTPLVPEPIDTPSREPVKPVDPEQSELLKNLQPMIDEKLGKTSDLYILDEATELTEHDVKAVSEVLHGR